MKNPKGKLIMLLALCFLCASGIVFISKYRKLPVEEEYVEEEDNSRDASDSQVNHVSEEKKEDDESEEILGTEDPEESVYIRPVSSASQYPASSNPISIDNSGIDGDHEEDEKDSNFTVASTLETNYEITPVGSVRELSVNLREKAGVRM